MSTDKEIKNIIINKLTKEQYKGIDNPYEKDEIYNIIDDAHYTEKEIQELLNTKQNVLTSENAGAGISIENGVIYNTSFNPEWGNIQGDILNQDDLQEELNNRSDLDLSNLSTIGADKLNTSKMYLTGPVSTDEQGYNQLEDMYHSSFDLSKFEVVGSPNITSDGVASGFSSGNYLQIPNSIFSNIGTKNWKIEWSGNLPAKTNFPYPYVLGNNYQNTNSFINCGHFNNTNNWFFNVCVNDTETPTLTSETYLTLPSADYGKPYNCYIEFTGTKYIMGLKTASMSSFTTKEVENSNPIMPKLNDLALGYAMSTGSLDLKQFSITVDGVPVFNGNKTGLDVIKQDNYNIVGSPTIDKYGIASNFNDTNYIYTPICPDMLYNKNYKIYSGFTVGDEQENVIYTSQINGISELSLGLVINNNKLLLYASSNSTDWDIANAVGGVTELKPNTRYTALFEHNENKYIVELLNEDTREKTTEVVIESSKYIYNSKHLINLGYSWWNSMSGSIDLNLFKVYVDGDLVYQPCLKIPYTESKTGSKIVDVVYRNRVEDLYNQCGQADYYTIDNNNKNFTLPMGEIYGMIKSLPNNDLSNLTENGEKHFLNKSQVTSCLLEVPEKIKYTLQNGVLTLKSGSEIVIPNGLEPDAKTKKFNKIILNEDIVFAYNGTEENLMICSSSSGALFATPIAHALSNSSEPTVGERRVIWFDVANNVIKTKFSTDADWTLGLSFPLFIVKLENSKVVKVKNAFNGFGIIGHHTFSYEGIKSLIPNGKNPDGTFKNKETITTSINIRDEVNRGSLICFWDGINILSYGVNNYFEQETQPTFSGQYCSWFNTKENIMYYTNDSGATWTSANRIYLGILRKNSSSGDFVEASFQSPIELVKKTDLKKEIDIVNNYINDNVDNINSILDDTLNQTQITNCLLEVPQNIKLELVDGVLTLKAGSKVIVPNGAGVFDEVVISNDIVDSTPINGQYIVSIYPNGLIIQISKLTSTGSGNTTPTTSGVTYYNTSENKVYRISSAGSPVQVSLPIAIITGDGSKITSIDHVFNGFGYIGSTFWADKGVKGLIPNGFNEDGTLNNIEFVTSKVLTRTYNDTDIHYVYINSNGIDNQSKDIYDKQNNINNDAGSQFIRCLVGTFNSTNGVISNYQPKQPFRAVDYNDFKELNNNFQEISDDFKELSELSNQAIASLTGTLDYSRITNCLLEVPQNIKLELVDGVLTLKAGSKVIVPNGVGVFKEVVTTQDQSITYTWTPSGGRQCMVFVSSNGTLSADYMIEIGACFSNSETGSYTYYALYDTINNKVKMHNDTQLSLPIAIITQGSDGVTKSIDQVFNGFGYIGSTVWVDKGVKALIPNGRNEDGTLKNIELTTTEIKLRTDATNATYKQLVLYGNKSLGLGNGFISCKSYADRNTSVSYQYVEETNNTYVSARTYAEPFCTLADLTIASSNVASLTPKVPFRALDYNEANEAFAKPYIGQIIKATVSADYVPEGTLPCDGAEYSATQFNELYTDWLVAGKLKTCTYTQYTNMISTYGQCSMWALDTTNRKFKVPTILNKIVTGTNNANVLYDMSTTRNMQMRIPLNDSLGRLNMLFNGTASSDNTEGLTGANNSSNYGQVQYTGTGYSTSNLPSGGTTGTVTPSKVNLDPNGTLYVDGEDLTTTIEVRYFVVVATGTINSSAMDWSAWASSLSSKVDKSSSWGFPSNKYVDLTLGASGTKYTAPANGYVTLQVKADSASIAFCSLFIDVSGVRTLGIRSYSYTASAEPYVTLPVSKGQTFYATYTNCSLVHFRFIYAEGEV